MKGKKSNLLAWILERRALSLGILILVLATIMALTTTTFLKSENLFNIFKQATITIILATGMTFIISGGGIDLSVANIMSLSCVMTCIVYNATHSDILSILTGALIGIAAGIANGVLATHFELPPFIVSMGISNVCGGLALVITKGFPVLVNDQSLMYKIGQKSTLGIPNLIYMIPLFVAIGQFVLRETVLGSRMQAVGGNATAAALSGLNVKFMKVLTTTIGGLFAGLSGYLLAGRLNSGSPSSGGTLGMDAICATVVGGTSMMGGGGDVVGSMVGAILMQIIKNCLTQYEVNMYWQTAVIGVVLIAVCAIDVIARKASTMTNK